MTGYRACEVCGAVDPRLVLRSARLDGPLVRCRACGLVYVGERERDFTFGGDGPDASRTRQLGELVDGLGIVARDVEEAALARRDEAERARVARLRRHCRAGRLLDVGSATGAFLAAAAEFFEAEGVEPDPGTSERARAAGLRVQTGTLDSVARPASGFDVVTMYHVIEHLDSPRAALATVRALLAPGGLVVIETPTVDNPWFRLAPARWRQLIPDHYFFFSRSTLERLLSESGFAVLAHRRVGRRVTLSFAADRMRRAGVPGAGSVARAVARMALGDRSVYLNPGDIIEVVARAV